VLTVHPKLPPEWPPSGLGDPGEFARDLPDPATLPSGSSVAITPGEARSPGLFGRIGRRPTLHLGVRCTALLMRGYVNIFVDAQGNACGQVPHSI
jgi:hypothetical protein